MIIVIDYFLLFRDLKTRFKLSLSLCLSYWDAYKQVMPKTSDDSRDMFQAVFRMDYTIKDRYLVRQARGEQFKQWNLREVGIS